MQSGTSVYASRAAKKELQKQISVVFQDYTTSTNPRFKISDVIAEGLMAARRSGAAVGAFKEETCRLLELVGLDSSFAQRFLHELSGGQLQRVCIARAVACGAKIILFDEAISSLDMHTQVQIMDLLTSLKEKLNLTYIFITHNLTAITYMCDQVLFLYQGRVTEQIEVRNIASTNDDYAKRLLAAVIDFEESEELLCK